MSDSKKMSEDLLDRTEKFTLEKTVKIISDACIKINCTIMTKVKALLMYHSFRRCVLETKYDPYMIAAACISISIKFNEEPIEIDAVILVIFRILDQGSCRSTESEDIKAMRKSLTLVESLILRMLNFSLNLSVAHEYLVYFINDLHEEIATHWHVFTETCMRLASDFYLSDKCLNYKVEDIAVTVVEVSLYLLGMDVNAENCEIKKRLKMLHECPQSKNIIEDIICISAIGSTAEKIRCPRKIHKV